jgi:hypothetical protein
MRAHFTNVLPINIHPFTNRAQTNFDDHLADISPMLRDQCTIKSKSNQNLNIDLDDNNLTKSMPNSMMKTDNQFKKTCWTKFLQSTLTSTASSTNQIHRSADSLMMISMTCKKTGRQVEQVQADRLYDYNPVLPPSSHASDDSFNENVSIRNRKRFANASIIPNVQKTR